MTTPAFGEIIPAPGEGIDNLPSSPAPYWAVFEEGTAQVRETLIGRGAVILEKYPFPKLGNSLGVYRFNKDNPVPAKLMGQVVNFFERIYDYQHTEAMVLLCMHRDTKEWRVFVPTQLVSSGGVNYVLDPSHIQPPWVLVGSIHSHCNFGAHESSTDTGDATDFDGFHAVIGHIKDDTPQVTAMVAMHGTLFKYYDEKKHPDLFDFSEAKQHEAPGWWDRYVEDTVQKLKPVGFDLFKKFDKDTTVKNETRIQRQSDLHGKKPSGYNPDDWHWDNKLGSMAKKPTTTLPTYHRNEGSLIQRQYRLGDLADPELERWLDTLSVSELYDLGMKYDWKAGGWVPEQLYILTQSMASEDMLDHTKDMFFDHHWEDELPKDLLDAIYNTEVVTEDLLDLAVDNPEKGTDPLWWRGVITERLFECVAIIEATGMKVSIDMQTDEPDLANLGLQLLPETTTDMSGVH